MVFSQTKYRFRSEDEKIAKEEYEPKVEEYLQKVGLTEFGEKRFMNYQEE